MRVVSSSPNRLVVKEPHGMRRVVMILGIIAMAAGVAFVGWYVRGVREAIPLAMLGALLAAPLSGLMIVFWAAMLQQKKAFDGKKRAILKRGLLWRRTVEPADAFKHVLVKVIVAEGKQREMVEVMLERPAGGKAMMIGSLRTTRKSLALVLAADEISRLLDLPLRVSGDAQEGASEVCSALERLERYKPMVRAA
jgi:hypothetical protein